MKWYRLSLLMDRTVNEQNQFGWVGLLISNLPRFVFTAQPPYVTLPHASHTEAALEMHPSRWFYSWHTDLPLHYLVYIKVINWTLCGTMYAEKFSTVTGESLFNRCCTIVNGCLSHITNQRRILFWHKLQASSHVLVQRLATSLSISEHIAVCSRYGIWAEDISTDHVNVLCLVCVWTVCHLIIFCILYVCMFFICFIAALCILNK